MSKENKKMTPTKPPKIGQSFFKGYKLSRNLRKKSENRETFIFLWYNMVRKGEKMRKIKSRAEAEKFLGTLKSKNLLEIAEHDFGIVYIKNMNSYLYIDSITDILVFKRIEHIKRISIISDTIDKRKKEFKITSTSNKSSKWRAFKKRYEISIARYLTALQRKYKIWTLVKAITITDIKDSRFI